MVWPINEEASLYARQSYVAKLRQVNALRASLDCQTVQEWLGHESLATTQEYFEPSKETEKQLDEGMKLPF
jgi:site-specific recombinase XerD